MIGDNEAPSSAAALDFGQDVVALALGLSHTCALLEDATVRCWGQNFHCQLGRGDTTTIGDDRLASDGAVTIDLGGPVVQLTAGDSHNCARLDGGVVRCWGHNLVGQLGLGHDQNVGDDEPPTAIDPVDVDAPVLHVDAGGNHTCVILEDHRVRCWGMNSSGELGQGHTQNLGDDEPVMDIPDIEFF